MAAFLHYTLITIGIIVLLLGVAYLYLVYSPVPALPPLSATVQQQQLDAGGRSRTFLAYVPAKLPPDPALVLVLHGSKIDGRTMRQWLGYEFDELADHDGFIVLYPDGYKGNWNDCRKDAQFAAKQENIDDVGFLRALVEAYRTTHGIDPDRVFAFGYSNGGQMAFRLASEQPRLVSAIAAIGANLPTPETSSCPQQGPMPPAMLVSNTADNIVPYQGGEVKLLGTHQGMVLSAQATAQHMARRNGLTQPASTETMTGSQGINPLPVERQRWVRQGQAVVDWYTVRGGGHVVPQARFRFPRINGQTATNLDTPALAVAFFGLSR